VPLKADTIIKHLVSAAKQSKDLKIKLVPVSINQDFILESDFMESVRTDTNIGLTGILRKIYNMKNEKLGRCIVTFCQPIDLNEYIGR